MTQSTLTNPQELENWLDEFMSEKMDNLHIPGVTFSLVQNGELFFVKGYGSGEFNCFPKLLEFIRLLILIGY